VSLVALFPNIDLAGMQLMTCDFIEDTEGHYMSKESFLNLRKYERMIENITLPTPIHLLDHIIILKKFRPLT